jgi:hypothetical protein
VKKHVSIFTTFPLGVLVLVASRLFPGQYKTGFWQLKKIQVLWIPNFIMNNDQVTHEKLTNTIYNLKQMIYMHKFAIKIVMALKNVLPVTTYLKLNKILIFDHFKNMYLYFIWNPKHLYFFQLPESNFDQF